MFTDKLTLAIAEAAKKCMDEELKGNQHKIDANKNGKVDADDFKILRKEKQVDEALKGNQHKIDANKNGKIDAQDFKILHKEETVNEEDGQYGYVAFSHDGKRHELHANTSYEAKQKAVKHFNPPKSKQHLVTVHLAQKDGKDVTNIASEAVQEAAIDDLRDRQAAAREANPYGSKDKKEPVARKIQGSQYGGSKQKQEPEKEVDESVQIDESKAHIEQHLADRDINSKVTGKTVQVHSSDIAAAKKHVAKAGYKDHKVVGGLNEEKMSDEDMAQREKIVKGMKKNLQGFKQRYGERAKQVMYATATKQAMKEETIEEEVTEGQPGKHKPSAYQYVGKHSDGGHIFKNDEGKKEVFYKVKSPASWHLQHKGSSYEFAHSLKEEVEQIDERNKENATRRKMMDASRGAKFKAQGNYTPDPEPEHKTAQAHNKAVGRAIRQMSKEEADLEESRGHKILATAMGNMDRMKNVQIPSPAERRAEMEKRKQIEKETDPVKKAELRAKLSKRNTGIIKAVAKLPKNESVQIDELSKDTLNSYVKKAEADKKDSIDRYNKDDRDAQGNKIRDRDRSPARRAIDNLLDKRSNKRIAGLKTANAKLAKEETEKKSDSEKWKEAYNQARKNGSSTANARARANGAVREEVTNDGFKAELEDNKAKAAGTKKQPDVAKAAVQSVKQESFSQKLTSLKEGVRAFLKGSKDE